MGRWNGEEGIDGTGPKKQKIQPRAITSTSSDSWLKRLTPSSSMWNRTLRCLRRVRVGECGLREPGVGETATLFRPKIIAPLPQFEQLKLLAREPFFSSPCPIAISPVASYNPSCSPRLAIQKKRITYPAGSPIICMGLEIRVSTLKIKTKTERIGGGKQSQPRKRNMPMQKPHRNRESAAR
jgi:hypothetical protein